MVLAATCSSADGFRADPVQEISQRALQTGVESARVAQHREHQGPTRWSQHLARIALGTCICAASSYAPSRTLADAQAAALPVNGLGPDVQLAGGVGVGLDGALRYPFLGRARLGALYVDEPLVYNAGLSFEVGALAKLGIGASLEVSGWRGLFAELGVARGDGRRWLGHLTLGYTVFGIEFQHRFSALEPSYALLLEVRLPLGLWWRLVGRRERSTSASGAPADSAAVQRPAPLVVRPVAPTAPAPRAISASKPAAESGAGDALGGAQNGGNVEAPEPSPQLQAEIAEALSEADRANARADHVAALAALQRAYMLRPDVSLLPRIARAELAQGRLSLAARDLRRYLADGQSEPAAARDTAREQLQDIERRMSRVRIELGGATGDEQIEIDAVAEPAATLGYDIALDPGEHELVVSRGERELLRRVFTTKQGELLRLPLELVQAAPSKSAPADVRLRAPQ